MLWDFKVRTVPREETETSLEDPDVPLKTILMWYPLWNLNPDWAKYDRRKDNKNPPFSRMFRQF